MSLDCLHHTYSIDFHVGTCFPGKICLQTFNLYKVTCLMACHTYPDNFFDFIYQRLLGGGFTRIQWETFVFKELTRVLKPHGWINLVGMNFVRKSYTMGHECWWVNLTDFHVVKILRFQTTCSISLLVRKLRFGSSNRMPSATKMRNYSLFLVIIPLHKRWHVESNLKYQIIQQILHVVNSFGSQYFLQFRL